MRLSGISKSQPLHKMPDVKAEPTELSSGRTVTCIDQDHQQHHHSHPPPPPPPPPPPHPPQLLLVCSCHILYRFLTCHTEVALIIDCDCRFPMGWEKTMQVADRVWVGKSVFAASRGSLQKSCKIVVVPSTYRSHCRTCSRSLPSEAIFSVDATQDVEGRFPVSSLQRESDLQRAVQSCTSCARLQGLLLPCC